MRTIVIGHLPGTGQQHIDSEFLTDDFSFDNFFDGTCDAYCLDAPESMPAGGVMFGGHTATPCCVHREP